MDISVIIPSYKPKAYIWECLESLYQQTLDKSRFELVFVLNGCCEPWKSEINRWRSQHADLNFNFIQTDTPGVSNARNIALDRVKGEYVTFIDDDDYISPEFLEGMLSNANDRTVVLTDSRAFIDGCWEWKENYTPHTTYLRCSRKNNQRLFNARSIFNGPCMKLIPISFMHGLSFDTSLSNGEDNLFMFEMSRNIKNLGYAPANAIYYRRYRQNSAVTKKRPFVQQVSTVVYILTAYTKAICMHPFSYNVPFVVSRYLAEIKSLFI